MTPVNPATPKTIQSIGNSGDYSGDTGSTVGVVVTGFVRTGIGVAVSATCCEQENYNEKYEYERTHQVMIATLPLVYFPMRSVHLSAWRPRSVMV
jgi:hypothetical protein